MKLKKTVRRIFRFLIENYIISVFLAGVAFVFVVSAAKILFSKPEYVYAKVRVSQGLWWASTQKPSLWMIRAVKKGEVEKNLTGRPVAEILGFRYYPWYPAGASSQYDLYLDLKLNVVKNKKTGKYNFKRATLAVASPVDLEFPSLGVSGTVVSLSEEPVSERYTDKIIYLTKKSAYPWEYEAVKIGDFYFDGEEKVFEIIGKTSQDTATITSDVFGNYTSSVTETRKYIIIKAKVRVKEKDGQFIYGEDQVISPGKTLGIATNSFIFQDYVIARIENSHPN